MSGLNKINIFTNGLVRESVVYALGVALGFLVSLLLLAGIRRRLRTSPVPAFLKGAPVLFVAAALLSMAFTGFSGLVK
jgi:electron transport complex protein RnfA